LRQNAKADIVAAICLLLISFLVFWISKDFPPSKTGIGVSTFPKLLAGVLIIFSIIIIIQAIKNSSFSKKEPILKEFKMGHIPGAVHIERGLLEFKINNQVPDKNAQIVVYCKLGGRGSLSAHTMVRMGYKNVINIEDGWIAWEKAGYPVE